MDNQQFKYNKALYNKNGVAQLKIRTVVDGQVTLTDIDDEGYYHLASTDFLLSHKGNDFSDLIVGGK